MTLHSKPISKKRILLWLLMLVMLAGYGNQLRKAIENRLIPLNDFVEYWSAYRIFTAGGNPYSESEMLAVQRGLGWTGSSALMMWNPPWVLPVLVPLCSIPYWLGRELCLLTNLGLLLLVADWLWRFYGGPVPRRWISWLATLFYFPLDTALFLGQISPLILFGVAGFLWAQKRRLYFLAGTFTLLISVKPQLMYLFWFFLILWILKNRHWKVFFGGFGIFLLCSLVVVLINPRTFMNYWTALSSSSGPTPWETPTWGVALRKFLPMAPGWVPFLPSMLGMGIAAGLWFRWQNAFDWDEHWNTIALLSVTSSSFAWTFDWVVLLPVVLMILCWYQFQPLRRWWMPISIIVMQILLVPPQGETGSYFHRLWFPPVLWLLYWAAGRVHRSVPAARATV